MLREPRRDTPDLANPVIPGVPGESEYWRLCNNNQEDFGVILRKFRHNCRQLAVFPSNPRSIPASITP